MNFKAFEYFSSICTKLKLSKEKGYFPCRVTGLANMEDVLNSDRRRNAFFAIDDTNDGYTYQGAGGTYFEKRMYIVYILRKFQQSNTAQQELYLNECRSIFRSICTKLIKDRRSLENSMIYLDTKRIPFNEITGYGIAGCTGLYFVVTVEQPIELCYDANQWDG